MAPLPQLAGNRQRLDAGLLPPADFITRRIRMLFTRPLQSAGDERLNWSVRDLANATGLHRNTITTPTVDIRTSAPRLTV